MKTSVAFSPTVTSIQSSPLCHSALRTRAVNSGLGVPLTVCRNSMQDKNSFDMDSLERDVRASAKVRMDMNRVNKVLREADGDPKQAVLHSDDWKVALSAALATFVAADFALKSMFLAGVASIAVFLVANRNPLDEGDGIEGPLARAVGRKTMEFVETSKPKLKAVARAVITDEEDVDKLREQIMELYQENMELRRWKEQRIAVDESLAAYTLPQLCGIARKHGLRTTGTKTEVLMRLVEAGVIRL